MKKFLKIFIVVLLVLAVIGGTVFFFFRKNKKENVETGSIVNFLSSNSKINIGEKLAVIDEYIVGRNKPDDRLEVIIETNNKLDDISLALISYYVETNTTMENKEVNSKLKQIDSTRESLVRMADEYCVKSGYFVNENHKVEFKNTYFDEHLGLNDLYLGMCSYLVQYAELTNLINQTLNVDRSSDFRFAMFELYANLVINTFSSTIGSTGEATWVLISDTVSINSINNFLKIRNSNIVKIQNENTANEKVELIFGIDTNKFIEKYESCNKWLFAKNFNDNLAKASLSGSNEVVSAYYLKLIFGI